MARAIAGSGDLQNQCAVVSRMSTRPPRRGDALDDTRSVSQDEFLAALRAGAFTLA